MTQESSALGRQLTGTARGLGMAPHARANDVLPQPVEPRYRLVHIGFESPGGRELNRDKDKHGHRYDSVGICNGVIHAGASCVRLSYDPTDPERMARELSAFDGYIVRINPGQLSHPGVPDGAQDAFDALMMDFVAHGKPVWSSPAVQTTMGAKDALVRINQMSCGLPDTLSYYTPAQFSEGFRKTAAFQPRVVKQNRGSAGEGVWLCWLRDKPYCANFGDAILDLDDELELMEMCDNHVERHTVREFIEFCTAGVSEASGEWSSARPGGYLRGRSADAHLVDQRLLPRVKEGEVRMLMVRDTLFEIIHKKPAEGGMSAVGGTGAALAFYPPDAPEYADLRATFLGEDAPRLLEVLGLRGQPLPLIWTADFIPADGEAPGSTRWIVGEFNCSCVGVSHFLDARGARVDVSDVSDEEYERGMRLCDLIGRTAVCVLDEMRREREGEALGEASGEVGSEVVVEGSSRRATGGATGGAMGGAIRAAT